MAIDRVSDNTPHLLEARTDPAAQYLRRTKQLAALRGMTFMQYTARIKTERWCNAHLEWHLKQAFGKDGNMPSGLSTRCRESQTKKGEAAIREERAGGG